MKITPNKIKVAKQIRSKLLTWGFVDDLLYREFKRFPKNVRLDEVAYKTCLIDKLYNCNVWRLIRGDYGRLAEHIISLKIDPDLTAGNIQIVDEISRFQGKNLLVFASKYAHFHQPYKFPIWDKFVAIGLNHILYGKKHYGKRSYVQFKSDIDGLINAYHRNFGSKLSYKDLDIYLWLYGQKINEFKGASKEVKDLNEKHPALFKQLL